jgi:uncharacterized protein YijF (DUF1287 family)
MAIAALSLTLALATAVPEAADRPPPPAEGIGERIAAAARAQVGRTLHYDPAYRRLDYPAGDLPIQVGVCADVVVRALREVGLDLQEVVHEDMKRNFRAYPQLWGLRGADPNIDHRRVANLMTYFKRQGHELGRKAEYAPGDIVAWRLEDGRLHMGIVSDRRASPGRYLMVHNIGAGAQEEDVLDAFTILARYRIERSDGR